MLVAQLDDPGWHLTLAAGQLAHELDLATDLDESPSRDEAQRGIIVRRDAPPQGDDL
jgi:hypothetical protein